MTDIEKKEYSAMSKTHRIETDKKMQKSARALMEKLYNLERKGGQNGKR